MRGGHPASGPLTRFVAMRVRYTGRVIVSTSAFAFSRES
jgi:hypothetical protein